MEYKQIEQTVKKVTLLKRAGRFVAPLAVVGIMAMPGNADAGKKKETGAPVPAASLISGKITGCKRLIGEGALVVPLAKCEMKVRKGDVIYRIEFVFEKGGYFGLAVANVDKKGVTFQTNMEAFMSESKGTFRVNYDGTNSVPGTLYKIKVERTSDPNVAKVTWEGTDLSEDKSAHSASDLKSKMTTIVKKCQASRQSTFLKQFPANP